MLKLLLTLCLLTVAAVMADKERVIDGAGARMRGHHHADGESDDVDHQAILGSKHRAEEFDHLPAEESQQRLRVLAQRMDKNGDGFVDEAELTEWIRNSMKSLDDEEAGERMKEMDSDGDNKISWDEYVADSFPETDLAKLDHDDKKLLNEDRKYFAVADQDGDGKLSEEELRAFLNPENYDHMHKVLVEVTLMEKDENGDGAIDLNEFLGEMKDQPHSDWHQVEKTRFAQEYDLDKDGFLRGEEVRKWLIPDLYQVAVQESRHLIQTADKDQDGKLSIEEIVDEYRTFVGSEATNYGEHLKTVHEEL
ncbi:unnamed protein product, partial [Mesorhabditis spiculigera]